MASQRRPSRVATESMSIEKQIFSVLREKLHPNIIQTIMIVPEGIFLPRIDELKTRWIGQIVSAAACLEALGYVHGNLTPRNLLLDRRDNIKLSDFGESVAFPAVDDLAVGSIIQRCWRLQYPSIAALDDNFQKLFVMSRPWYRRVAQSLRSSWETLIDRLHYWVLRKHCKNLYARLCEHGLYALPLVSGSA
ncbi:hypothetical protein VTN96DRAFT_10161 [Rasamsonia emersonii]